MPVNLSIKNAPDQLVQRLRERAERHHRSLQGELMAIIEAAAQGWIEFGDLWPLIHGAIRFSGWAPIDAGKLQQIRQRWLIQPEQSAQRRSIVACPAKIEAAIVVTARKPRRR
jgi:hypothetical protein